MSAERLMGESRKYRALEILAYFVVAVGLFGAGMLLESLLAGQTAALMKLTYEQELKQARQKADEQTLALTDTLSKERENHAKAIRAKDENLAAFTKHAAGVRNALETDVSAARSSGAACTARIAGIAEALGGIFDSVGEVAGIAQDLGRENKQLKADNKSLSTKLAGWQKWNAERTQRIVITAQKNG
jgi:hypothetical protein